MYRGKALLVAWLQRQQPANVLYCIHCICYLTTCVVLVCGLLSPVSLLSVCVCVCVCDTAGRWRLFADCSVKGHWLSVQGRPLSMGIRKRTRGSGERTCPSVVQGLRPLWRFGGEAPKSYTILVKIRDNLAASFAWKCSECRLTCWVRNTDKIKIPNGCWENSEKL